ncbi:hypothetical protein HPB48_011819 [Haemaphysalis longicornis]|uniref:Nucleoprotein TPR n=1 Tax=Haemaphysalis longicornis TaxID=44386 RepID=A0A9J6FRB9_HAELO|nr:hypothetical protein HPB48_011819 [Haemaphysalis longicornis]
MIVQGQTRRLTAPDHRPDQLRKGAVAPPRGVDANRSGSAPPLGTLVHGSYGACFFAVVRAGVMLADILDGEELQALAEPCKAKLENFVNLTAKTTEELREENAQLKARCERSSFQLEAALSDHRAQTSALEEACERSELGTCRVELESAKAAATAAKTELEATKRNLEQVTKEKKELLQALEKRTQDLAALSERTESLQVDLSNSQQQLREQAVKLEELQLQLISAQHAEKRLQQERELVQSQVSELREEAVSYRQEAAQLRRDKAGLAVDLQSQLDEQKEHARSLSSQLETWRSTAREQEQRAETLAMRLRDAQESHATLESHFHHELQAQAKLTDMHKDLSESRRARVDELVATLEEMQALLLETKEAAERSQEALREARAAHQRELEEREGALEGLRKELQLANSLLQAKGGVGGESPSLFSLSVAAAHVSGLALESGLSLTELLSERLEQQRALGQALRDKETLQQQLTELSQELAEKVPLVARHMKASQSERPTEYEKAMSSVSSLREQLTGALVEQEQRARERDEARSALAYAQRELQRWQHEARDLSRQVCQLVQEVEEARGGAPDMSQDREISSSEDGMSPPLTAAEVISRRLVTFRPIHTDDRVRGPNGHVMLRHGPPRSDAAARASTRRTAVADDRADQPARYTLYAQCSQPDVLANPYELLAPAPRMVYGMYILRWVSRFTHASSLDGLDACMLPVSHGGTCARAHSGTQDRACFLDKSLGD